MSLRTYCCTGCGLGSFGMPRMVSSKHVSAKPFGSSGETIRDASSVSIYFHRIFGGNDHRNPHRNVFALEIPFCYLHLSPSGQVCLYPEVLTCSRDRDKDAPREEVALLDRESWSIKAVGTMLSWEEAFWSSVSDEKQEAAWPRASRKQWVQWQVGSNGSNASSPE